MKITISGTAGSGKGTISHMLAKEYNLTIYDLGDMRREEARKKGMTIAEFNAWSEAHPDEGGDKYFDQKQEKIGIEEDDFVFVGRLSWHFIPKSIKLFLKVSDTVAAQRIFAQAQKGERVGEDYKTLGEAEEFIIRRNQSDVRRYNSLYGINHTDESHYDLVIDTSELTADQTFAKVVAYLDSNSNNA